MIQHTVVFIHGMGDTSAVARYETLWTAIRSAYEAKHGVGDAAFAARFATNFVDWEPVTADAKTDVFKLAFPNYEPRPPNLSALAHPIQALRTFMTYFLGDVAAYVSENDNNIRRTVWNQMTGLLAPDKPYSIVAHSLGAVIAFDFLFNLFGRDCLFDPLTATSKEVETLKQGFRNLFTLGSPSGLFMLRKGELWDPRNAGVRFGTVLNPVSPPCQWLNFWDAQDVVAYPLEQLFRRNPKNESQHLRDIEVETGDFVVNSHLGYWRNADVARDIAAALPAPSSFGG